MDNNIFSVLITAITVLGGASAWRFYEKRADRKEKDEEFIRQYGIKKTNIRTNSDGS
jgi:hypothetical protein